MRPTWLLRTIHNSDGEVVFANLDYQRYYVDVFETWHDNYTLAAEEGGVQWIETPLLSPDLFYIFTAYVDVYDEPANKGATSHQEQEGDDEGGGFR